MPRLQILHHKSYHPYNAKNKQRVREDEAKARAEEQQREQAAIEAESSARLIALRQRAGSPTAGSGSGSGSLQTADGEGSLLERHRREKARAERKERRQRERLDFDFPSETARRDKARKAREGEGSRGVGGSGREGGEGEKEGEADWREKWSSGGHINLFADIENAKNAPPPAPPSLEELARCKAEQEADKFTMYLGRPERETKPWYADRDLRRVEDTEAGKDAEQRRARERRRDARAKDRNDPLTSINKTLAADKTRRPPPRAQSERERALALVAKRNASAQGRKGWETPEYASWQDELEQRKDNAGRRFHDAWESASDAGRGRERERRRSVGR